MKGKEREGFRDRTASKGRQMIKTRSSKERKLRKDKKRKGKKTEGREGKGC